MNVNLTLTRSNEIDTGMKNQKTVCVFCGSSIGKLSAYADAAYELGKALGSSKINLIYGGGCLGLMGIVADAAIESGSTVTGVIPNFLQEAEISHNRLHRLLVTNDMHQRKRLMYSKSDAFISLPGGVGTFDETMEVITWTTLGLLAKPIILVNINRYWDPFIALIRHSITEGFSKSENENIMTVVDSPNNVISILNGNQKDLKRE